jgi:protein-disulfide isomerase/uncharacterized membrane protein
MEKREIDKDLVKKIFILFFAFIGFLTTIKLAFIYYEANFDRYALPSFCSISEFIDCDGVAQTVHSQFFGVPLAYWGMFFYLFIIFLVFVDKLKNIKFLGFLRVFEHPLAYISSLGIISFMISMLLATLSIFEMKKICILCFFTYFLNLLIAIIAGLNRSLYEIFKTSVIDFFAAIKVKQYLISFLGLVILASAVLTYTTTSYIFTPQVKYYDGVRKYADMKVNPYKFSGNVMGDANAKTIVYIYTDYRCPICKAFNVMISKAAREVKGIKIIHKNLPLDNECNKSIPTSFHVGSCMLSRYAISAEKQEHFWEMNSLLFENQPKVEDKGLSEADVLKLAKSVGLDTAKLQEDSHSAATKEKLSEDIDSAIKLKIEGTPTMVINGKVYVGIKPYFELRDILMRASAGEKK